MSLTMNYAKQSQFANRKTESRRQTTDNGGQRTDDCSLRLLINPMKTLYKSGNDQYYVRHIGRCSSMVEHSFRKAEVEGSTPSIGCSVLMRVFSSRERAYGDSN